MSNAEVKDEISYLINKYRNVFNGLNYVHRKMLTDYFVVSGHNKDAEHLILSLYAQELRIGNRMVAFRPATADEFIVELFSILGAPLPLDFPLPLEFHETEASPQKDSSTDTRSLQYEINSLKELIKILQEENALLQSDEILLLEVINHMGHICGVDAPSVDPFRDTGEDLRKTMTEYLASLSQSKKPPQEMGTAPAKAMSVREEKIYLMRKWLPSFEALNAEQLEKVHNNYAKDGDKSPRSLLFNLFGKTITKGRKKITFRHGSDHAFLREMFDRIGALLIEPDVQ